MSRRRGEVAPRRVFFAAGFDRAFRSLRPELQEQVRQAIHHFRERTNENALPPERKAGLQGIWALRVTRDIRVFYTQEKDAQGSYSRLVHVGPHDDYRIVERRRPR